MMDLLRYKKYKVQKQKIGTAFVSWLKTCIYLLGDEYQQKYVEKQLNELMSPISNKELYIILIMSNYNYNISDLRYLKNIFNEFIKENDL